MVRLFLCLLVSLFAMSSSFGETPSAKNYTVTDVMEDETHDETWAYDVGVIFRLNLKTNEREKLIIYRSNCCEVTIFSKNATVGTVEDTSICPNHLKSGESTVDKLFFVSPRTRTITGGNLIVVTAKKEGKITTVVYQAFMTHKLANEKNEIESRSLRTIKEHRYLDNFYLPEEDNKAYLDGELIYHIRIKANS